MKREQSFITVSSLHSATLKMRHAHDAFGGMVYRQIVLVSLPTMSASLVLHSSGRSQQLLVAIRIISALSNRH